MTLAAGTRLGPYEIINVLGAGGMGEVYRAKDTRLDRIVALKVLSPDFSSDPERRQRFEREARTISSVAHPHICSLYDVGNHDGIDYLVMEFLEGETLTERIKKSAIPMDQVLRFGIQIADAMDRAHKQGIVHRDLKPGNIMLTKSGVKLLDFGLAKLQKIVEEKSHSVSMLATEAREITKEGTILGTIQYMSPEQLEGKDSDARTDIFAFGAVLYEMATGKHAFEGKSQASLIAAILSSQPEPISAVQPTSPPAFDRVVKTCLQKDPEDRWQNAHDLSNELKWIAESSSQSAAISVPKVSRKSKLMFWQLATLILLLSTLFLAFLYRRPVATENYTARFNIYPPEGTSLASTFAVSPNGKWITFIAADPQGKSYLWLRSLDSVSAEKLSGTDNPIYPFWSPDSQVIAFFAGQKLKRIDITNKVVDDLCDVPDERGASWGNGVIIFSPTCCDGLYQVPTTGGKATPLTSLNLPKSEFSHRWPWFLPDGRRFIFTVQSASKDVQGIYIGSLDSKSTKRISDIFSAAEFALPNYFLTVNDGALIVQTLDVDHQELKNDPQIIAQPITLGAFGISAMAEFSVSQQGLLAYRTTHANMDFHWLDRAGKDLGAASPLTLENEPSLSPDEKHAVIAGNDVNILDLSTGRLSRLTFSAATDATSVWSPDGSQIIFSSDRDGAYDLYAKPADGSSEERLIVKSPYQKYPDDISRDGKFLLYEHTNPKTKFDLWLMPMSGDQNPRPLLVTPANECHAQFSPNVKFYAYVSDESGKAEVYVRSFNGRGKWQISNGGGDQPQWRRDGKELFYFSGDSKLMSVPVSTDSNAFQAGVPQPLFQVSMPFTPTGARNYYQPLSDGQRLLFNLPAQEATASPITVAVNWVSQLKK